MIYFSYFGNKRIPSEIVQIGIARYEPSWWNGANYKKLAPTGEMLNMNLDDYKKRFDRILSRLNPDEVVAELNEIAMGKDVCLLCFEKPPKYCHRHDVMIWFKQAGYKVKECAFKGSEHMTNPVPNGKESRPRQNNLFG